MNYFQEENNIVESQFDIKEVLDFTLTHDVQIIRGEDYNYLCYIGKNAFGTSITPMGALWFGIQQFKKWVNE